MKFNVSIIIKIDSEKEIKIIEYKNCYSIHIEK
jgi:hypothetical protein